MNTNFSAGWKNNGLFGKMGYNKIWQERRCCNGIKNEKYKKSGSTAAAK